MFRGTMGENRRGPPELQPSRSWICVCVVQRDNPKLSPQ
jgi:hypothetical protein